MENLSHSHHHRQQNMVPKKTLYSNGATATKALYHDIFGGPPRFGATTLSPRVEEYNEIFGGFHSSSRASSIPVLDLPVVHDDDEEVFFDVRSSLGFDYGEVFGAYTNDPDFALSFEELMVMESNGACHGSSSDDAWIPADAEYLSEESDHSASNQCLSNGDSHESIDDNMEFNISYHKASQSTNEDMINGVTGVTQLLAVPGYSFMVDNSTSLPKTDPPLEGTDNGHLDIDFTGEMLTGRHLRKTVSHPSNSSASGPLFRSDVSSSRGYVRNGSFPNESFITISDLSLRTQPSQLPPPSRPPPPMDVKMRDSGRSTPNCDSVSSEGKSGESSPPYFDVEVDASSSAAASTAAIKEAMDKAQAKLKSAQELMDRKRDGFHCHIKSSSKNGQKGRDVGVTKDAHGYGRTKKEKVQDYYEGEDDIEFSIADERLNFANSTLSVPDSSEGKKNVNMAAKSSEVNYREESFSSQDSDKVNGAGEWKYAGQFFELVQVDESRTAFDQVNNENILVHNCIVERGKKEKKSTVEALEMQQANVKKVKAVRADYGLEEYPEKSKEACVWEENNQAVEYGKRQTRVEDPLQQGSMSEVQQSESTCGVKQTMKCKEKEQQTKANKTLEDQRSEMRHEEAFEQKEDEKKLEAASEQAQNERRVKEERKEKDKRREEREKKQKEARKREENERRLREALECEENERKLKDTREKEDNDRRIKDTLLKEENERRQKEVLEQEENSKREKEAHEENEKRLKEASEKENERRLREARERQENERKIQEALEMEENEKRIHEKLEQEKIERQKEADEREENEKRRKDSFEKEQNGKRIIEESETEDTGKQLRGVYEEEENGKLREPHEGDESETELTKTCELEGVGDMSHKACNMEQTESETEDTGKQLRGVYEEEENGKLREPHEGDESETELTKTCELEGVGDMSHKACNMEQTESETEDTGKQLRGVYEEEENGKLREPHEGDESETELTKTCELEGVGDMSHKACNMEQTELRHPYYYEGEKLDGMNTVKEDYTAFSATCVLDDEKNLRPSRLAGGCQGNGEKQEATEENARGQVQTKPTDMRENEKEAAFESANVQIFGKTGESTTMARGCFDHLQSRYLKENTREIACAYESVKKVAEARLGIGHNNIDKIRGVPAMEYDIGNQGKKLAGGERGKVIMRSQVAFDQEGDRVNMMSNRIVRESIDSAMKVDVAQPAVLQVKGSNQRTTQQVHESQSIERKMKTLNDNHSLEEKEAEKVKKEKLLEMERLRKMEEQREREREREKDRMAVDRAALEARERAYSESREKAERAAVERATAEARRRALNEARERLEKACAEAREKSLYDKPSIEARLRAERAAVDRATAETRERAFEKAMAERVACEVRVRIERSVSEKFSASSRNGGMRPSASSSDLQDQQLQASGSFTGSRYPYSAVNGSYYAERSEGVEGESAQRCKARLERHRRTAERAAKALAEKNMCDLLAQREQAERNRLAETLDADVKRWSSGKEGNLRALLSTLQYILGHDCGWHPVPLTEVITSAAVKRAYRKATLCVHPDKLQQRGATIQQKYVCEKVFDLLKEAWNKFNSEER